MAGKREKPEDILSKPRQVEVLQGQGVTILEAVRQIGVTQGRSDEERLTDDIIELADKFGRYGYRFVEQRRLVREPRAGGAHLAT